MKRLLTIAGALMLLASGAMAQDKQLTIAAGKVGGGYAGAASSMATRLKQRGYVTEVKNFEGSDEITLAMCNGNADIGITQVDAVDARAAEGCNLVPLGDYGDEVAVLLFPPKSDNSKLKHLTSEHTVQVDTVGSGTDLFWHTIVRIENSDDGGQDQWSKANVLNDPLELAETNARFGTIDAVVMVHKSESSHIRQLLARGWYLGELYDRDIDDYEFNGTPLYESAKLKIASTTGNHKGYGYTVRSFYMATKELAADRRAFATLAGAVR